MQRRAVEYGPDRTRGASDYRLANVWRRCVAHSPLWTQDPIFLGDINKSMLKLHPLSGEELQAAIAGAAEFPKWLIDRARRF
jgi:hypothetical protein